MWEKLKVVGLVIKVFGQIFFKVWFPLLLWLATAWWFDIYIVTALLIYIAVCISGLGLMLQMGEVKVKDASDGQRDFYVVIDSTYRWNPLKENTRGNLKAELGETVYAFENFEAAKALFVLISNEHYSIGGRRPWLKYPERYMDGSEFDEQETRLWVVPASSKKAAFERAYYDESRRLLGYGTDASTEHLVLITDSQQRREEYIAWWTAQREYRRNSNGGLNS